MSDEEDEDLEEGWSISGPRIGVRPLAAPLTSPPDWPSHEREEWDKENKQLEKKMLEKNIRVYGGLRAPRDLRAPRELDEDELDEDELDE